MSLLKLGARITVSVRRILIAIASSCPYQDNQPKRLYQLFVSCI